MSFIPGSSLDAMQLTDRFDFFYEGAQIVVGWVDGSIPHRYMRAQ